MVTSHESLTGKASLAREIIKRNPRSFDLRPPNFRDIARDDAKSCAPGNKCTIRARYSAVSTVSDRSQCAAVMTQSRNSRVGTSWTPLNPEVCRPHHLPGEPRSPQGQHILTMPHDGACLSLTAGATRWLELNYFEKWTGRHFGQAAFLTTSSDMCPSAFTMINSPRPIRCMC